MSHQESYLLSVFLPLCLWVVVGDVFMVFLFVIPSSHPVLEVTEHYFGKCVCVCVRCVCVCMHVYMHAFEYGAVLW